MIGWVLLYGNEKISIAVMAGYPIEEDKTLSSKFERTMLSFLYQPNKEIDPMDGLVFSLDTNGTPLSFASTVMQTGALFNSSGNYPSGPDEEASYMVLVMPFQVESDNQRERAIRAIKKPGKDDVEIAQINAIEVDGLTGFEVIGYSKKEDGVDLLNYSLTLFDTDRHFIINGFSKEDSGEKLEIFRQLSQTFRLKK
jgi:hypothetical protein